MKMTIRLFTAIDFPVSVKEKLARLKSDIPTARWVNHEQMHVTLFFIGDTDRVDAVKDALETVKFAPFDLAFAGVGRFPLGDKKPPRVLWAGIHPQPALNQLQAQVSAALAGAGFQAEDRPFSPHITLARLKTEHPSPETSQFLSQNRTFQTNPTPISEFILFSSVLTPQGPRYRHEAVYPLST
jgi:2'-5' RNA ligase